MAIIEDYFSNSNGEKFRFRENIPDNTKAAILCVHGYAEHIGRYLEIERFFVERGFSFHIMENRGHGKSVGQRGHIDKFDIFIEDLHGFRQMVDSKIGNKPLFGLGHSNGSLILARYSLKYGSGIRGIVLSGLPIRSSAKINPIKFNTGIFLSNFMPKLTLPSNELDPKTLCHDKKIVEDYIADPLVHKVMSLGFVKQFFGSMQNLLDRAQEFKTPVLFQHGGDDRACDPAAAREFYENISSTDKQMIIYDGLYHEIFNEPQKDEILSTSAKWMEDRI